MSLAKKGSKWRVGLIRATPADSRKLPRPQRKFILFSWDLFTSLGKTAQNEGSGDSHRLPRPRKINKENKYANNQKVKQINAATFSPLFFFSFPDLFSIYFPTFACSSVFVLPGHSRMGPLGMHLRVSWLLRFSRHWIGDITRLVSSDGAWPDRIQ